MAYAAGSGIFSIDVPIETMFKGIWPFLIAALIQIALLIVFPEIVLFIPNRM